MISDFVQRFDIKLKVLKDNPILWLTDVPDPVWDIFDFKLFIKNSYVTLKNQDDGCSYDIWDNCGWMCAIKKISVTSNILISLSVCWSSVKCDGN